MFVVIDTANANATSYQDLSVTNLTYNYRIKAYNVTGSSAYSNVAQVSVPVELTSFSANIISGNVNLNWQTATETNNSGFNVERNIIQSPTAKGNLLLVLLMETELQQNQNHIHLMMKMLQQENIYTD